MLVQRKPLALGSALLSCAALAVMAVQLLGIDARPSAAACPRGFHRVDTGKLVRESNPYASEQAIADAVAKLGAQACLNDKHPEPARELFAARAAATPGVGPVPPGAYRKALQDKAAMAASKTSVAKADGEWVQYGNGPLVTDDERFSTSGLGIGTSMGRVDSFAYDPENNRLFALIGTGGVWMSEAETVEELGDHWQPIGDGLPTLINGAVEWTSAGGGRLLVVSGEHVMGGGTYTGLGAFWSDDLGASWHQSTGVPDAALGFEVAVDRSQPNVAYVATSMGLFRSTDAGESYVNVNLPTSPECQGVTGYGPCQFANFVTDVVVKEPGGITDEAGGQVLAAVGYRAGHKPWPEEVGGVHAPGNGLYRSDTGEPDSFAYLDVFGDGISPIGFARQERIGRTELGLASGAEQDHNLVYAVVEDAVLFNGGFPLLDIPEDGSGQSGVGLNPTVFNGIYVSSDFGSSWMRLADDVEILNPDSGSALSVVGAATLYGPGVQSWYNQWILPDPTRAASNGAPTRLLFGLEEVWQSKTTTLIPQDGIAQVGVDDYEVIGVYFAGDTCQLLSLGVPVCPTNNQLITETTTHPDQHDGIFVPTGDGGVCFFAGNDGGVFKQCVAADEELDNTKWGRGHNEGFYTLLPYGLAVAKDGRVWFGLQDNGSGYIDGETREMVQNLGGDGFYASVDPDNSDYAWATTQNAGLNVTTDGGLNWTDTSPPVTSPQFANYFVMDPLDPNHVMTAGNEVVEVLDGPTATWVEVFNLGTNESSGATNRMNTIGLYGDAAYVAYCGVCDILNSWETGFNRGIATNVGGAAPPKKGTADGWHFATAAGLPNRFITSIKIDPADPATIYLTLGGYSGRNWVPPGSYLDTNQDIGVGNVYKSTDAGESFVNISGNLPSVHANWLELHDGQLVVATEIGVFISSDKQGSEWAVLGDNLPNVIVTMLQNDPADPKQLLASTFGRHIWEYTFEDDGAGSSGGGTSSGGTSSGGTSSGGTSSGGSSGGSSSGDGRYGGGGALTPGLLAGLLAALLAMGPRSSKRRRLLRPATGRDGRLD